MKQRFCGISLLVTALAALALGGPASAGDQVPFKGKSSGVVAVTDFTYPFATFSVTGEGEATYLGHFTVSAVVVVNVTANGRNLGSWTLTAANGDMLFLDMVGIPGAGNPGPPPQGFADFTVVGGTGRFQGATGHYTQVITFSALPGSSPSVTYTDVIEGTISSPGSNK